MNSTEGVAHFLDGNGRVIERETFTCVHCQAIVVIGHKAHPSQMGGHCYSCDALTCPDCAQKPCDHFEEKLARVEASYHARRSYGLI